jgi:hypothetical protein
MVSWRAPPVRMVVGWALTVPLAVGVGAAGADPEELPEPFAAAGRGQHDRGDREAHHPDVAASRSDRVRLPVRAHCWLPKSSGLVSTAAVPACASVLAPFRVARRRPDPPGVCWSIGRGSAGSPLRSRWIRVPSA